MQRQSIRRTDWRQDQKMSRLPLGRKKTWCKRNSSDQASQFNNCSFLSLKKYVPFPLISLVIVVILRLVSCAFFGHTILALKNQALSFPHLRRRGWRLILIFSPVRWELFNKWTKEIDMLWVWSGQKLTDVEEGLREEARSFRVYLCGLHGPQFDLCSPWRFRHSPDSFLLRWEYRL